MKIFPLSIFKTPPLQKRNRDQKGRPYPLLSMENLESRINPTDLVVSDLLFRGNLISEGALWKATDDSVEIGFTPAPGEAFHSLVTLTGSTVIDSTAKAFQFQGTGSYAGPTGAVNFWDATQLGTYDIQKLVSGGEMIRPLGFTVAGMNFQPGTLRFDNPGGGSSDDARLLTTGRLDYSRLPGLGLDVSGANSVSMGPNGIRLSGVTATVSGEAFVAGGATFDSTTLQAAYSPANDQLAIFGSSHVTFADGSLSATFGDNSKPGLIVTSGVITDFRASLSGSFSLAGGSIHAGKLSMGYDFSSDSLPLSGPMGVSLDGASGSLAPLGGSLTIRAGAIDGFQATFTGTASLAGATARLTNQWTSYSRLQKSLSILGQADFSFAGNGATLVFAGSGLVLKEGTIQSLDATLNGSFSVAGASLGLDGISVVYSQPAGEISLANGKATFVFGANNGSILLGPRGLVIKNGQVDSIDATLDGTIAIAGASIVATDLTIRYTRQAEEFRLGGAVHLAFGSFDLKATLAPEDGLVIRSGAVESIDATLTGSVTIAGASVTLSDSAVTYSRVDDRLTVQGTLGFAYESNQFQVGLRNQGLVVQGGIIVSLDGVADGKIGMAGTTAVLDHLSVVYSNVNKRLQLTGGASVTIGESSVAFDFLADKGGLVIENGTLANLAARARGIVVIDGNSLALDGNVTYNSASSYIECSGGIALSLSNGNHFSASGLLKIRNGSVEKISSRLSADLDVGGIQILARNLSLSYDSIGDYTGLRISMPQSAQNDPALSIVLPAKGKNQKDTVISIPSLEVEAGIRIVNGSIESFTLECSGAFTFRGLGLKQVQATISYSTLENTVVTIQGSAEVELGNFGITVSLGRKGSNGQFISPGFRLVNGEIDTVDISLTGELRTSNGFTLASVEAGVTYVPNGSYLNLDGEKETGDVWGIYGKFSPLGWKFSTLLAFGTKETPGILINAGDLLNNEPLNINFVARLGLWGIDGVASITPVAADPYVESNGQTGWQPGETILVDQNHNGKVDDCHFDITLRSKIKLPFIGDVYANMAIDSQGGLSGISISIPTNLPVPGTPLIVTALAATVENLDNPSNLSIKGQIGMSLMGSDILTSSLSKLDSYYDQVLDLQVFGKTDLGIQLPDIPSLPTVASAHFTGEIAYSPGKLVITAKAWLFAVSTRYNGKDDTFLQADGQWSGLVESTGKIYLDWANSRYYASLNTNALGGLLRSNALLGMDFANSVYVVQAGATLDVEGTSLDHAPLNWFTPLGAQFIVLISPSEKFVGGWFDTPFGPGGAGYDFIEKDLVLIGKTKVKSLKAIADKITIPQGNPVPLADRKFTTDFTFNYSVADIEADGGLSLSETNSITLNTSFLAIDNLAYERTTTETRSFPNFIAPGQTVVSQGKTSTTTVQVLFDKNNKANHQSTLAYYTILPVRYSEESTAVKGQRKGTLSVTIYPFVLNPGTDYDLKTGELTGDGRKKVQANSRKTFDKSLFAGGNVANIVLSSNTPALIVNDSSVAEKLVQPLPVPAQGADPVTPNWLKIADKNYSMDGTFSVTYPKVTQVLNPDTGTTTQTSQQVTQTLSPEISLVKNVTPPQPLVTPGTNGTIAYQEIDSHTNQTQFTTTSAAPETTVGQETKMSLLFAAQADAARFRWQAVVCGNEVAVSGGYQARAVLVQDDSFSTSEILSGQVSSPLLTPKEILNLIDQQPSILGQPYGSLVISYLTNLPTAGPNQPVIFLAAENGVNLAGKGTLDHWAVRSDSGGAIVEATIKDESGKMVVVPLEKVQPARINKADILLSRLSTEPGFSVGAAYTAAVVDPKTNGSTTDLAVFRSVGRIEKGILPGLPSGSMDSSNFVIEPLPAGVSRQVNVRLATATRSEIDNEKWLFKPLNELMRPVTVTGFGDTNPLPQAIGSENIPLFQKVQGHFQLGTFTGIGTSAAISWEEDKLTGVPQYGFVKISDGINPPQFSAAVPYTPTPALTGSVKLFADKGTRAPLSGLVVYVDANGNHERDTGESFTVSDSQGFFSFYNLVSSKDYSIVVELPGGAQYRSHGSGADLSDPVQKVTADQGISPEFLLDHLGAIYRGRVVIDSNGNALVDEMDPPAENIDLRLTITNGTESKNLNTISDGNGFYLFEIPAGFRSVGRPQVATSRPELGVFVPDVKITNPLGITLPENGPVQPKLVEDDIIASKVLTIHLDGLGTNELLAFFKQLPAAFVRLKAGDFNAVSIQLFGFKLLIDSYEIYGPNTNGLLGLKYASGWAFLGQRNDGTPNQVRFTLGDRQTGGLALKDGRLQGFQLSLEGSIQVAGILVDITGLNARFDAGRNADGSDGYFQLLGQASVTYQDYQLALALMGDGLIVDANGIRTFSGALTGSIPIAGQKVELGSLAMGYDRSDDSLTFSGSTQWTMAGDTTGGNYFGLDNVSLKIGLGNSQDKQAGVRSLSANLAAGLRIQGVDFDVSRLSFSWLPASDAFSISGKASLQTSNGLLAVNAAFPGDGIVFSSGGLKIHGTVSGSVNLGENLDPENHPPVKVSLDGLDLQYVDSSFHIRGQASLTVNGVNLALASGDLQIAGGVIQDFQAAVSGQFPVAGAVLTLGPKNLLEYHRQTGEVLLSGEATVSLEPVANAGEDDPKKRTLVGISGWITVRGTKIDEVKAVVTSGVMDIAGASIQIQSLGFHYQRLENQLAFVGAASLEILGSTLKASFPEPGIVWRDGSLEDFHVVLSGDLPLEKDSRGNAAILLKTDSLGVSYSATEDSLSLVGSASIMAGGNFGKLETDSSGIVFAHGSFRNFSGFLTLSIGFGAEKFTDFNKNLAWDKGELFVDSNGNGKYDSGLSLNVSNAGVSYSVASAGRPERLLITGKGILDFDGTGPQKEGVTVDLSSPGIEWANGAIQNFSLAVSASFDLKTVHFQPTGSLGVRYLGETSQLDIFGGARIRVADNEFDFSLGTSFDNPGIRFQFGVIAYASAALTSSFRIGDLKFETKNAGFTYNLARDSWAIYGSVALTNVFSVGLSLGDQAAPGLLIRDNDWVIDNLTLSLQKIQLGAFGLDDAKLTIRRSSLSWSVYAKCAIQLPIGPGLGAAGEFSLVNGKLDLISVTLASATGINIPNTPLFINYLNGSIRNLSNLSQITLTGSMGVGVGTQVTVLGKIAQSAQFVGSFTLDPSSLKIQVDAYLGAINNGSLTQPKWNGLLAQGTGIIFLDWSRKEYYADLNLAFLSGVFVTSGRLSFSDANGLVFRSSANLRIPESVPLIGGVMLASADFLFVQNPGRKQFFAMGWGQLPFIGNCGIKYDVNSNNYSILNDDEIKAAIASSTAPSLFSSHLSSQGMAAREMPILFSSTVLGVSKSQGTANPLALTSASATWDYSGQSDPIPVTEVSDGTYLVRFQVKDPYQWSTFTKWKTRLRLMVDPVDGVTLKAIPFEFDPVTGLGSIGVQVLPLPGQYLPRGLTLHSRLISPVELTGPDLSGEPSMASSWTQAFSYAGQTPPVGFDKQLNPPPEGLQVREGRFTISFRPVTDPAKGLPSDWVHSLRLYLDPVEGVTFDVTQPFFDTHSNQGIIVIVARKTDGSFLDSGMRFSGVIRSKVQLGNPEDPAGLNGGTVYPLLGVRWVTDPAVVDTPLIASRIQAGIQITTLTGHVNDPRVTQVEVSLYYSTDLEGNNEYSASLAGDGNPAEAIPVNVNADGSWSMDIFWDTSGLPTGDLWLYGLVSEGMGRIPVYGESAGPFRVTHSIDGRVTDTRGGYSGLSVFADLNGDGKRQTNEPGAITDDQGGYTLDVPAGVATTKVIFDLPAFLQPAPGETGSPLVDLTHGPLTRNLNLIPSQTIVRGSVFVTGDLVVDGLNDTLGQPVSGLGVILTGPGGIILRTTTNNRGQYEVPVLISGNYTLSLELSQAQYLGFQLGEMPGISTTRQLSIGTGTPVILQEEPLRVDSVGLVTQSGARGSGSLASLVDLSNQGYVSSITFDESLQGTTIDITLPADNSPKPYYLWDGKTGNWILVTPPAPQESQYGETAFILEDDLRIDGGNLGITLREKAETNDLTSGFRAFYVQPGVDFLLENVSLVGFTSKGVSGQPGTTGETGISGGGAAAGGGGAILNRGKTTLNHVHFINNSAQGGQGGDADLPVSLFRPANPGQGGMPLGANGTLEKGGAGGGYQGGLGGNSIPVILTYTLGDDPTLLTTKVTLAAAGGGGSGLGGAIYNATGATLIITGGSTFSGNIANGGLGGIAPQMVTNLANALFGDSAHTVSVTGLETASQTLASQGSGLGGAIFNKGNLVISHSTFSQNLAAEAGGALYSVGGSVAIDSSAILYNKSRADQGIHFVADAQKQGTLVIDHSLIKGSQSFWSGKPFGPAALVVSGGRSSGSGNLMTSQTGFQGESFSSRMVPRPASPFTGQVFIPSTSGPGVNFGAISSPAVLTGSPRPDLGQPFELTFALAPQPGQPVPSGRLIIGKGSIPIAEARFNSLGKATVKLPGFHDGTITLTIYYEGDGVYAGNISTKTLVIGTPSQRIVQKLYRKYLGRDADGAGLRNWASRLDSGIPLEQLVKEFRLSQEASHQIVQSAYREILGRSAEKEGLNAWTRYLQEGRSEGDLRSEFLASGEYQSRHSSRQTINAIYQFFLGHEAGQAGIETWLKNWERGMSLAQVIQKVRKSRESKEHLVDLLYQEILDRPADGMGLRYWTAFLDQGLNQDGIRAALLQSKEFSD